MRAGCLSTTISHLNSGNLILFRAMSAVDVVVPASKKICRSLVEGMGVKF